MAEVSIIIPVFNTEKYVGNCLKSCINQSFKNIEIIVVNDASTDNSEIEIERFKDSRIKYIKNSNNLGTFLARKIGAQNASAEFMLFLDGDDCLELNAIEVLLNLARKSGADIINFGIIHEPFNKYATLPKIHTQELLNEEIANEIIIKNFNKSWLTLCTRLYRTNLVKKALEKTDFINSHLTSSEDTILFFVIALLAQKSVGIDEKFYIYCQNTNSNTRAKNKDLLFKQIDDREYLKSALNTLDSDFELTKHKYYFKAKKKIKNLLDYFICYSKKFLSSSDLNAIIPPYFAYSLRSMRYMPRYQTLCKLVVFVCSLGSKKL